MKYLPQVAISWETAAVFSLSCFALGATLCALALRRRREKRGKPAVVEFVTAGKRKSAQSQNASPPSTIEALAQSLWLKNKPEISVLSDSQPTDTPAFRHLQIRVFWTEEIEPHHRLLEKRGELPVIEKILLELDCNGICSSVVAGDGKSTFEPTAKRFSRITLLDHSLRVARRMKEAHDAIYTERILYGKHLIAALAHDIGKMEHLRQGEGRYVKDDHAAASARALNKWIMECGGEKSALELRATVDAVRNHHRNVHHTRLNTGEPEKSGYGGAGGGILGRA